MLTMIWIERETLTDGSHVYNVKVPATTLAAYDEESATALATNIACEIDRFTINAPVGIKFNY